MASARLRVLFAEDNPSDARLIAHELSQSGFDAELTRVENERAFVDGLATQPDIVLCDWSLPQFDALRAMDLAKAAAPGIPFIIVSGSIGEEAAADAIKRGATDYLLKDRLSRLGPAVRQAIAQQELRAAEQRAQTRLRESEAQYRALADSIPQIVWTARPDGTIEYLNLRAREYSGLPDVAAWTWAAVVHPADLKRVTELWAAMLRDQTPRDAEFRIRHADGTYRWHITRQTAARDASGALQRWIGTCTDIHDQKSAAEVLARDAQILAGVRDAVIVTDLDGVVTYWNEGATRLFGWTADEMIGVRYAEHFPEAIRGEFKRELRDRAIGSEWAGEFEDRRKDGARVWLHARFGPIAGAAGRAVGILGLAYDVTDRRRAEESLAAVMRSVSDAILTIDERGIVQSANPAAEHLFGCPVAELTGSRFGTLLPDPDARRFGASSDRTARTSAPRGSGSREVQVRRRDGAEFPAELAITEFRLEGQRFFTAVVRNLTERKRLEEQFRQAQKMEAIGRLAGGIAHDFNNLLTVINGYTELLLPLHAGSRADRDALAAIRQAGERAAALTSQLLAFSRKAIITPKVFDLNAAIAQSEKLLRRLIGEDVTLVAVPARGACLIVADPTQVDQVVMNLAVNARDAMPTGGMLTIETRLLTIPESDGSGGDPPPGRYAELIVQDSGCGMSEEVKARLFEPFFTTKEPGHGTGLGLSVVHGIVKQAGGYVFVESALGRGTTFRILFPEALSQHSAAAQAEHSGGRGNESVLLVEDDVFVRSLCKVALESQGYAVLAAADGKSALDLVSSAGGSIDILVTDVVMPGMSGRELADLVRARLPNLKVLYVSGYTDDAVILHGVRQANDVFLHKPFTPLGLARRVREVLDGTVHA